MECGKRLMAGRSLDGHSSEGTERGQHATALAEHDEESQRYRMLILVRVASISFLIIIDQYPAIVQLLVDDQGMTELKNITVAHRSGSWMPSQNSDRYSGGHCEIFLGSQLPWRCVPRMHCVMNDDMSTCVGTVLSYAVGNHCEN